MPPPENPVDEQSVSITNHCRDNVDCAEATGPPENTVSSPAENEPAKKPTGKTPVPKPHDI